MLCRYLERNVHMSEGWRQGKSGVPVQLHHRPLHLTQHMTRMVKKAQDYIDPSCITNTGPNTFSVRSSVNKDVLYAVSLGSDTEMPSCQCWPFQKSHLPCKHFAALLVNGDMEWDDLPVTYRENPVFTLDFGDVRLTPPPLSFMPPTSVIPESDTEMDEDLAGESNTVANTSVPQRQADPKRRLKKAARDCREALDQVKELTYNTASTMSLEQATATLHTLYAKMKEECPSCEGMVTEARQPSSRCSELPSRKKSKRKQKVKYTGK